MNVYTVVHIYGDDHDTEEHLTDHCVYNSREKAEAVRRARKLARKRMQREGLIAAPKPKVKKF